MSHFLSAIPGIRIRDAVSHGKEGPTARNSGNPSHEIHIGMLGTKS